jgi:uncharacterized coiled-coil protein SlyX
VQSTQAPNDFGQFIRNSVGDVLQAVNAELKNELSAAIKDRNDISRQLTAAKPGARAGLSEQLAAATLKVDKLQAAVDKLDAKTDRLTTGTGPPPPPVSQDDIPPTTMIVSVISILFIGFPLAIAFARIMWRRASHIPAPSTSQLPADSTRRFDQLEHAVDAIAIEVERISENQRYLTKLLSEPRQTAAVGSGRGGPPPAS